MTSSKGEKVAGPLDGIRVVEVADEQAEYCGLLLAGLGADVVKVEPAAGGPTRSIGPFYMDRPDPEGSLYFWHYNRGKRSVVLDLESDEGAEQFWTLVATSDVLLQSVSPTFPDVLGLTPSAVIGEYPELILARMTPFGDKGPWVNHKGCDLVHLALGGVAMNCGYDPEPSGAYDFPPIAPQMWHSYHIAGDQLVIAILAALLQRSIDGCGQYVSCAVHQAVSANTELDTMFWVMRRAPLYRHTCRHANEQVVSSVPTIGPTKDGRWIMCFLRGDRDAALTRRFLARKFAMEVEDEASLTAIPAPDSRVPGSSAIEESTARVIELAHRLVRQFRFTRVPWREAQEAGVLFAPLRLPHENVDDEHWLARGTYAEVDHPEIGRALVYPVRRWRSDRMDWQAGRRAPRLGEDQEYIVGGSFPRKRASSRHELRSTGRGDNELPVKLAPLSDIRVLDFTWFLATAGATRFLAALGAECIKVEWKGHPDSRNAAMAPVGGRQARQAATGPLEGVTDLDMGGQFHNKNAGKLGLSLNIQHPEGLKIAKQLAAMSDVVAEGFSPGVLERLGLGYEVLRSMNRRIIYAQQSGFGTAGRYGRYRMFGPTGASMAGLSEMSGMPSPMAPVGWGYSYLDWIGAYSFAQAIMCALLQRESTGEGQWVDASQCEAGLFLSGTTLLDWSINGRPYARTGNRSPYKPAAPHGIYRTKGIDSWIALACFDQHEWEALTTVAEKRAWREDERFATLSTRIAHQDELDAEVERWSAAVDGSWLVERLQEAGVPAGQCQTAADKCERDPQLEALEWLREVRGTRIGTWPIVDIPFKMSRTTSTIGGPQSLGAPCYGEHNEYVLGELLGMSKKRMKDLAEDGVI
jgi:crotonobetainyl-CoA:carnitine CoA-transferase CaiB-like acyl-CoA transferase